jgi:hypothetical protein
MVFGSGKHTRQCTTRRQDRCHAKLGHDITRYHPCWPRTDPIPWTNLLGEHRAKAGKSKVFQTLPVKHIASKAEYTNTQQGLPRIGYTLAHS